KPGYRSLGLPSADILSVSPTGEMLVAIDKHYTAGYESTATLARVSLSGGAPRPILEGVLDAAWSPDGKQLAVIRSINSRYQLEYPIGTVLYHGVGWISSPRVSPKQDMVAFLDHTLRGDDQGFVAVVDLHGKAKTLTSRLASVQGLEWSNDGKELWFAGTATSGRSLNAVDLSGKQRIILTVPG